MAKYRKKPVVIEAEQFLKDRLPWPEGCRPYPPLSNLAPGQDAIIDTLEGAMCVTDGDFIITGVEGERYPCKPGIFEKTYELVE